MKLGSTFTDPTHGRCTVIGSTPLSFTLRDAAGKKHIRRKPNGKRWRAGARCRVVPDREMPGDSCGGVVLDLDSSGRPWRVRLCDHPVWNGAIVYRRDVFRLYAVEVV